MDSVSIFPMDSDSDPHLTIWTLRFHGPSTGGQGLSIFLWRQILRKIPVDSEETDVNVLIWWQEKNKLKIGERCVWYDMIVYLVTRNVLKSGSLPLWISTWVIKHQDTKRQRGDVGWQLRHAYLSKRKFGLNQPTRCDIQVSISSWLVMWTQWNNNF